VAPESVQRTDGSLVSGLSIIPCSAEPTTGLNHAICPVSGVAKAPTTANTTANSGNKNLFFINVTAFIIQKAIEKL
jgi:hypothetical protein